MRAEQLGVQAHCLRAEIAADLDRTLVTVAEMGVHAFEMISFPGCRGNWWGDFGPAADLPAPQLAEKIRAAGLICPACMVTEKELAAECIEATLDWVQGLGCQRVILSAFSVAPARTLGDWREAFMRVDELAERVSGSGLEFVLHTQPELWSREGSGGGLDALRQWLEHRPALIEYDPTGAIIHGVDPALFIRQCVAPVWAVHMRDGVTPPEPVFYLAAEALGSGTVDWGGFLQTAESVATAWYMIEMETVERTQALPALRRSIRYLRNCGLLS